MAGLFMECIEVLKNYIGGGYLFYLYLAALVYLFFTEKEKRLRALVIYAPLCVLVLFMLPFSRLFYVRYIDDAGTYYRILWLIPVAVTAAHAACRLFAAHRRVGLMVTGAAVALAGVLVYKSPHISKAENLYNIPQVTINVSDFLLADAEYLYIHALFPKEHVHYVRQYNADIRLPYGRDILVAAWGMYDGVYEAMEGSEIVDIPALLEETRDMEVNYIIMHGTRPMTDNPNNHGLTIIGHVDDMLIYLDEVMMEQIVEKYGPYLERRK